MPLVHLSAALHETTPLCGKTVDTSLGKEIIVAMQFKEYHVNICQTCDKLSEEKIVLS